MKITVSDHDKRMLLILALFFAALGYYYLLLDPLFRYCRNTAAELRSKKEELAMQEVKTGQFGSWQSYHATLGRQIAGIFKRLTAPWADAPVADRIGAIMEAANRAGVRIADIKPLYVTIEDKGQKAKKESRKFIIEGHGSFPAFLQFLRNLYGMKIDQFNLATGSGAGNELRINLQLESLPRVKHQIADLDKIPAAAVDFSMENNLFFSKRSQKNVSSVLSPETQQTRREQYLRNRIGELQLQGTVRNNGQEIAIIKNPNNRQEIYGCYKRNDVIDGMIVTVIRDDEVWLIDGGDRLGYALGFHGPRPLTSGELAGALPPDRDIGRDNGINKLQEIK